MNDTTTHYDVIVIGSGAGGAAAAHRLVKRGWRVALLEKGPELPVDGSTLDVDRVIRQGVFKSQEPWLDKDGATFVPEEYFNLGGKTKWYGAAVLRYAPHEFEADAGHQCLPWPISYRDLAPYYDEAEKLLGVREFDPEPDIRKLVKGITRNGAGWRTEPLPLALAAEIVNDTHEAKHFDAFASVKGFKADGQCTLLEPIRRAPNLTLMTNEPVVRLVGAEGQPGRIAGVVTASGKTYRAGRVLLAMGAMHSPRLLQEYLVTTGLARRLPNYHLVGSYFKRHILTAMLALSPSRKTDLLRKTLVLLNQRFPHSSVQPLGFDGELMATLFPSFVPRWLANGMGERAYGLFLQTEDGSDERNRVRAANGAGKPQLDYDPLRTQAAVREHRALVRALQTSLLKAGFVAPAQSVPLAGTAHACGTLVTGSDPARSVVDALGKVHGMENLYVVDGSILPRSSRVNPSLTIYAWALRVAAHLTDSGVRP